MKNKLLFLSSILIGVLMTFACSQKYHTSRTPNTTADLIRYWKDRYSDTRLKAFTFEQATLRYRDGQPGDTILWYEAIQYPNSFRIDLGEKSAQNSNLWRNDSIYVQRKGKIVHRDAEVQASLILEGALYDFPMDRTLEMLRAVDVDPAIFTTAEFEGRPVYIIGAPKGNLSQPQLWVDAERRIVVRRFSKSSKGEILEGRYGDFIHIDGHWVESYVAFYRDGELIQEEWYKNINVQPKLDPQVFDPEGFRNTYWY